MAAKKGLVVSGCAEAMAVSGEVVVVGPDSLSKALTTMAQGGSFLAKGPGGEIRFDDKGDRAGNAGIYCAGATAGVADKIVRPGYILDSSGKTQGAVNCP